VIGVTPHPCGGLLQPVATLCIIIIAACQIHLCSFWQSIVGNGCVGWWLRGLSFAPIAFCQSESSWHDEIVLSLGPLGSVMISTLLVCVTLSLLFWKDLDLHPVVLL